MSVVRGRPCAILLACALGCEGTGGAGATSGTNGETTSAGSSTTDGGTTFGDAVACTDSTMCEGGFCVAPYDPGAGTGVAGMGTPVCVPSCVQEDSLDEWCVDDASCCEGLACNAFDGFCVGLGGSSSDGVGETWVVDSSSEGTSGTTDGASSSTTDAGSTSDSGTSTG